MSERITLAQQMNISQRVYTTIGRKDQIRTLPVNIVTSLADGTSKFVPNSLVASGSNGGGAFDGLAATNLRYLAGNGGSASAKSAAPKAGWLPAGTTPAPPGKSSQD